MMRNPYLSNIFKIRLFIRKPKVILKGMAAPRAKREKINLCVGGGGSRSADTCPGEATEAHPLAAVGLTQRT